MLFSRRSAAAAAAAALAICTKTVLAQDAPMTGSYYVDAPTGINFSAWSTPGGSDGNGAFAFGYVLPDTALQNDTNEYIGLLQCQTINTTLTGWCGIAHGGHMPSDLLLMAWPYQGHVYTSFRYVTDYFMPLQFGGPNGTNGTSAAFPAPRLTVIRSTANATGYEIVYRCQNCFSWQQGTYNETVHTATGDPDNVLVLGFAQAAKGPLNPACPGNDLTFGFHDNGYGQWGAPVQNATRAAYAAWAKLATQAPNAGANLTAANCAVPAPPKTTATAAPSSVLTAARRAVISLA
ncbi:Cellobiose dehydrogenase, cytochrome [Niveomyces insectorum RCEF 264]|uniref:Cellobiose dehydrogenase, cytochrome n=1 Tax=Niveomyces insectorum RCEF 264 TaxID=1081102 RepID=A0A167N2M5_9HYPO|nr:Cellobiose dehydrogenase, cytochrome [Niveomyces insectorum RCEF 264]